MPSTASIHSVTKRASGSPTSNEFTSWISTRPPAISSLRRSRKRRRVKQRVRGENEIKQEGLALVAVSGFECLFTAETQRLRKESPMSDEDFIRNFEACTLPN